MRLNSKMNKATAVIIAMVFGALYIGAFVVLEKTPITIIALAAGIFSVLLFFAGNFYFLTTQRQYPWTAAIPMTLWRYLITATLLSAVFVIAEKIVFGFKIPEIVLIVGHILVFAFYLVMLLLMHSGKKYIDDLDNKVAEKKKFVATITEKLNSLMNSVPEECKKDVKSVLEAIRYSDPMSNESAASIEQDIEAKVLSLSGITDATKISDVCKEIIADIQQRNILVKNNK